MRQLREWLQQVLADEKKAALEAIGLSAWVGESGLTMDWQWVRLVQQHGGVSSTFHPGAPSPQQLLADIEAKESMLEIGMSTRHLQLLAQGYGDRAGYLEEWRI